MVLSTPISQLKRRAKLLARDQNIPLHSALDQIAQSEGFNNWSLLSARSGHRYRLPGLLHRLSEGEMLLIGARPGQGKTLYGIQLLLEALECGRRGYLFSLEYTLEGIKSRFERLGYRRNQCQTPQINISDEICADFIIEHLTPLSRGDVVLVDYLQLLDQKRTNPDLTQQLSALKDFAQKSGAIISIISQIDRNYDSSVRLIPDIRDVRAPNMFDTGIFTSACFIHNRKMKFQRL